MYTLEYLPIAMQDMVDIAKYIPQKLSNPVAAERLANEMIESADKLTEFPYINPVYYSIRPLKKEYRRLIVKNYIMFYYVDEPKKLITIARVIYAHRNYNTLLD